MTISPFLVLAVALAVVSVWRFSKSRRSSSLLLAGFWVMLGATIVTEREVLLIPTAVFLGIGIYQKFAPHRALRAARPTDPAEWERIRADRLEKARRTFRDREPAPRQPEGPTPVSELTTVSVDVCEELRYPVGSDRALVIEPGKIEISFRISEPAQEASRDDHGCVRFEWRLADSEGNVWKSEIFLLSQLFNDPWHRPWDSHKNARYEFWSNAPREWTGAMRDHCVVAGIKEYMDSRDLLRPVIGGISREIFMKHQGTSVDVAFIDSENRFVVRTSGLLHRVTEVGSRSPESVVLDPFGFEMSCEDFLPSHNPGYYFSKWREWWSVSEEHPKTPFGFSPVPETSEPQPTVQIQQRRGTAE